MWRDRWFTGLIGTMLACLACLTTGAVVGLGAIGLNAWTGHLDIVLLPVLAVFIGIVVYRYRAACRKSP